MNNIKYVVKVKESFKDSFLFNTTSIGTHFCGELVNQYDGNFYFELLNSKALVIIPHESIEWMAPMKKREKISNQKSLGCLPSSACFRSRA